MAPPVEVKTNFEAPARVAASSALTVPTVQASIEGRVGHRATHVDLGRQVEDALRREPSTAASPRGSATSIPVADPALQSPCQVFSLSAREVVEHQHLVPARSASIDQMEPMNPAPPVTTDLTRAA